jgi:tetratricopeptide (TPR) repeat protein
MGDLSRRLGHVGGRLVDPDTYGAAFLGDAQVGGDVVAGNKILQLPPEQRTLPAQLPADTAGFTGRRAVLNQLDALTSDQGPRTAIITAIHGMAGVGKTALAVHWAHRVADQFPDGQLYVDMRGYSSSTAIRATTVLGRFLRALGVPDDQIPEDEDERAALYRSVLANRRALIILDNVSGPQQVRPLLPGSRSCRTLITSRNQLSALVAHTGVRALAIDVMSRDEAAALITTALGTARMAAEPKAAERLAQQCSYLPLAMRIAIAHVAMRTYASITDLVDELAAGNRLATLECDDDPHLAVRAAFDLSYRHLAEPERRSFRHVGLVEGPDFTPQIVAALLGIPPDHVRRSLRILANAHLIEPKTTGRFRLHDLLREYARERVQEEEVAEARDHAVRRLAGWYVSIAAGHGHRINPYRRRILDEPSRDTVSDHATSLAWFEVERAGLIATAHHASCIGDLVWMLADAAYDFLRLRRYNLENIELHGLALAAAQARRNQPAQVHMLHHLAALHLEMGRYDESMKAAKNALRIDISTADTLHTRRLIGHIYGHIGRYIEALDYFERDLRVSREMHDQRGEATTLTAIGMIHRYVGRQSAAIDHFARALGIQRTIGDRRGEASTLTNLVAIHHWRLGRSRQAADEARQALRAQRDCADRVGQAETLSTLALISSELGQLRGAIRYAQRSQAICRAIGDRRGEARALETLARLHRRLGHFRAAEGYARGALAIHRDTGNRNDEARTLDTLARCLSRLGAHSQAFDAQLRSVQIHRDTGDRYTGRALNLLARFAIELSRIDDALRYAEEGLGINRMVGDRISEADSLHCIARIHRKLDRPVEAVATAREALTLRHDVGDRRGESESLDCIARVHLAMANHEQALEYTKQALTLQEHIDFPFGQGWALDHLGRIYLAMGNPKRAMRHFEDALRIRRRIRDRYGQARTLNRLAKVYLAVGRPDEALAAAKQSMVLERDTLQPDALAERLAEIARITEQTQGG